MRPPLAVSLVILTLGASAVGAGAQAIPSDQPPGLRMQPMATADFLDRFAQAGQFEEQDARLAIARSSRASIREAAERVVHDQQASRRLIASAARQAGLPPPRSPGLDLGQTQRLDRLRSMKGAAFDRLYVEQEVHAHSMALDMLTSQARDGQPGPIRRAALSLIPKARADLSRFTRLCSTLD